MPIHSHLLWGISITLLLGIAPVFYWLWIVLRLVTAAFHRTVYEAADDFLYSLYQKLVLFFFENCSGIEVCHMFTSFIRTTNVDVGLLINVWYGVVMVAESIDLGLVRGDWLPFVLSKLV
jgi:hypothetical protein